MMLSHRSCQNLNLHDLSKSLDMLIYRHWHDMYIMPVYILHSFDSIATVTHAWVTVACYRIKRMVDVDRYGSGSS